METINKNNTLQSLIQSIPDKPGVYQFFNEKGEIIYIGKAKSLKKRVASYFIKDRFESGKTAVLTKKISDIKYIIVDTEFDALLLENNFIKKHQPRYNVQLKDDKSFPWICIKNEPFPRVFPTRNLIKDGSSYYGPYASVKMMSALLELITQLFQLRNCNLHLTEDNIQKKKFKVCLEYHIGNCKGPCEGLQTQLDYDNTIRQIKEILKGNINGVITYLKNLMHKYASNYEFEKAQHLKDKLNLLEKHKSKSVIVNPAIHNVDVFSMATEDQTAYVNFFKVINGSIVQSQTLELKKKLDENDCELLTLAIAEIRTTFNSNSKEIIVPLELDMELPGVTVTIPKIGDKKHLLDLSEKNVRYYLKERQEREEKLDPLHRTNRILTGMMHDLRLKELPVYIECIDNSNIQGAYPVAAVAVFINGKPSKKDYRLFNIRTVQGPNDFASMEEIVYRRYKRMQEESKPLPQLIVIDGGKGQLNAALKSLERLGIRGKTGIIGIAKKLEEIYYPDDPLPLYLDKKSETLKIIQHLRDETHRFGITHHRKKRSKGLIKTQLSDIKGIGPATADTLLKHFKSVKQIKKASPQEITNLIGKTKANLIIDYFKKEEE